MPRVPRMSRTVRTTVAVIGCAAFFGAAGLLAGRATGLQNSDSPSVVAAVVPGITDPASSSDADVGATGPDATSDSQDSATATTVSTLAPLGTKVAIVGDSLTEGVRSRLTPLAKQYGFDAKIDAQNGRDIEAGLSPLKKISTGRDLVMVALGTNDARTGLTAAQADTRIEDVLDQVGTKTPVLWVNVYRTDTKGTMDAAELFNERLTAAAPSHPNLTVLDWSSYIQSRPELIREDHIHLTSEGYDARASWMARQIAAGLRLPQPDVPELTR